MKIDGRTLTHDVSETIRIMAVRGVKEGERPSQVIKSYGLCRTTIYQWLRAAARGGEAALTARKASGPPCKLSPKRKRQVRTWICGKDPRQYGFDFGLWTRRIVAALIHQRMGIALGFVEFLKDFLKTRRRPVFLVVDRHPAHIAKVVAAHVQSLRGKLELHFLPGYAPDLNPDEFVWNHLRQKGVSKTPLRQNQSLRQRVEQDLANIKNDRQLVRSFFHAPTVAYAAD